MRLVCVAVGFVPGIHGVLHSNVRREWLEGEDEVAGDGAEWWVRTGPSVDLVQPGVEVSGNPLPPESVEAGVVQVEDGIWCQHRQSQTHTQEIGPVNAPLLLV